MKRKQHILCVDDQESNLFVLEALLENEEDLHASYLQCGNDALKFLLKERVDLILLDIMMPDMDGYEVARIIRSNPATSDIPIIFVTAKNTEDAVKEAFERGGNDYVSKPIRGNELLARMRMQLAIREKDKEIRAKQLKIERQAAIMIQQSHLAQMGGMLEMIAHQWRQPISAITSITGLIEITIAMGKFKEESCGEHIETINNLCGHLSNTIDDFRNYFKTDKQEDIALVEKILKDSLKIINPTLINNNIEIIFTSNKSLKIKNHVNEIKQVILSILKNAQDALLDKEIQAAKIWIDAYEDGANACIKIEDNAGGVPENVIDNVFEAYFSTKKHKNGTGLGLYMSKIIIENHCQGKLAVHNTQNGASFTISLPLFPSEAKE